MANLQSTQQTDVTGSPKHQVPGLPGRVRADAADPGVRDGNAPPVLKGEVHGTTHLYAGQEAVAVGACLALRVL